MFGQGSTLTFLEKEITLEDCVEAQAPPAAFGASKDMSESAEAVQ